MRADEHDDGVDRGLEAHPPHTQHGRGQINNPGGRGWDHNGVAQPYEYTIPASIVTSHLPSIMELQTGMVFRRTLGTWVGIWTLKSSHVRWMCLLMDECLRALLLCEFLQMSEGLSLLLRDGVSQIRRFSTYYSWNCCGAGNNTFLRHAKEIVRE